MICDFYFISRNPYSCFQTGAFMNNIMFSNFSSQVEEGPSNFSTLPFPSINKDIHVYYTCFTFLSAFKKKSESDSVLTPVIEGRVRFGAADSVPPIRRRCFGAGHFGAGTIGRQNLFFLDSFFCSYVVSVCSSIRSR